MVNGKNFNHKLPVLNFFFVKNYVNFSITQSSVYIK